MQAKYIANKTKIHRFANKDPLKWSSTNKNQIPKIMQKYNIIDVTDAIQLIIHPSNYK